MCLAEPEYTTPMSRNNFQDQLGRLDEPAINLGYTRKQAGV